MSDKITKAALAAVKAGHRDLGAIMDHMEANGIIATPNMIHTALEVEREAGRLHKHEHGGWKHPKAS